MPSKPRRDWTLEQKREILRFAKEHSAHEAAEKWELNPNQIYKWGKKHRPARKTTAARSKTRRVAKARKQKNTNGYALLRRPVDSDSVLVQQLKLRITKLEKVITVLMND